MNGITGVIAMHRKNTLAWFLSPWCIVLTSFLINLFIALLVGAKTGIYTGGLSSIYIFLFVMGIIILNDTFPFALGMSVRRTDYYLGTLAMALLAGTVNALLLCLMALIEHSLTNGWGVNLHFFHLPYLNDGTLIEQLCIIFVLVMHMYLLGFFVSSIYQRFKGVGLYVFFGLILLLASVWSLLSTYLHWWVPQYHTLAGHSAFALAMYMVPLLFGYALASFALLRRATVR